MKKLLLSVAIVAMFAAPNAHASDKESGAYAGIDLGYVYVDASAQEIANEIVTGIGGSVTVTQEKSAAAGRVYAGYNINKTLGIEVGYLNTTDLSTTAVGRTGVSLGSLAYTGTADVSVSGIDYAVLVRPFDSDGLDGFFVKGGGHSLESTVEWTFNIAGLTAAEKVTESGTGWLLGVGYETSLTDTLDYRVAYTYYDKISGVEDSAASFLTLGIVAKF